MNFNMKRIKLTKISIEICIITILSIDLIINMATFRLGVIIFF